MLYNVAQWSRSDFRLPKHWVSTPSSLSPCPICQPMRHRFLSCVAPVKASSRDTALKPIMTFVRLIGGKRLREPCVSQLLGEGVASCPLAKRRWVEALEVGYPSLICINLHYAR